MSTTLILFCQCGTALLSAESNSPDWLSPTVMLQVINSHVCKKAKR